MEEIKNITTEGLGVQEMQEESYKSGSVQYIDSREVAEIVEKKHCNLVRDIKRYTKELNQLNFESVDFFIQSSYVDGKGEHRPCYLVTKKGCEFIAHKLTGIKGTKFTATYINRFHEMEDVIANNETTSLMKLVEKQSEVIEKQSKVIDKIMMKLDSKEFELARTNNSPVLVNEDPFNPGKSNIEERLKKLNSMVSDVANKYGIERKKTLHYLYQTIERNAGVSIEAYLQVYRHENEAETAFPLQVIAANMELYSEAVELIEDSLERKKIFG